jgi:hypothetical protein
MIEFRRFIYLDVHRTGSTHMIHLLRDISGESEVRLWRHYPISAAGYLVRLKNRMVFSTVRNPWSWYVSLWGHGVDGHSAIRRMLLQTLPASEVAALYDASRPAASFQRWLTTISDAGFTKNLRGEGYPESGLSSYVGLYTYRFQRVTTRFPYFFVRSWRIGTPDALAGFHQSRKLYQTIFRTETLTEDLVAFCKIHGERCGFKPNAEEIIRDRSRYKRNASSKPLSHYRDYYDAKSRELITTRERFFLDEFGYEF